MLVSLLSSAMTLFLDNVIKNISNSDSAAFQFLIISPFLGSFTSPHYLDFSLNVTKHVFFPVSSFKLPSISELGFLKQLSHPSVTITAFIPSNHLSFPSNCFCFPHLCQLTFPYAFFAPFFSNDCGSLL